MNEAENILTMISGVLLRSFVTTMVLLILWMVAYLAFGDYWCTIHAQLFDITANEIRLFNYIGMGILKILAVCFLFAPFVAIQLVIRSKKNN